MTPEYLSATWGELAPAVGNHLWHSTVFAAAAGLLTWILRKNHAQARYWLWMAASLKFLIPFSLLVSMGSHLAWLHASSATNSGLYVAIEQISQPFTQTAVVPVISQSATRAAMASLLHMLPTLLAAIWGCGFAAVVFVWCARWRRISVALREGTPLRDGREAEMLRRLERIAGTAHPIQIVLSKNSLEPGIFGIARPILVWPDGISKHLEDVHLQAILAHEVWHVRRRDNLAAAIHMLVEALFWFHPLVWWVGARLVEERERACDEEVLEFGSERQAYAESILKVCEFCVGSPLACVSGVTGSDLRKRMVYIMTEQMTRKLEFGKKVLLGAVALLALTLPIVFGLVEATPSRAQVDEEAVAASLPKYTYSLTPSTLSTTTQGGGIKRMEQVMFSPDGFVAANIPLQAVIQEAYGVQANQIEGVPEWAKSAAYNLEVKIDKSEVSKDEMIGREPGPPMETRRILRAILADRFKLALHYETKDLRSYALVVADEGSKLQPSKSTDDSSGGVPMADRRLMGESIRMKRDGGQTQAMEARNMPTTDFATQLSRNLGTVVVDKTELPGKYDFTLRWTGDTSAPGNGSSVGDSAEAGAADAPSSIFTALEQQLGLKLEPQKAPTKVLVIDHVEQQTKD